MSSWISGLGLKRLFLLFVAFLFTFSTLYMPPASALTQAERDSLTTPFFDPDAQCSDTATVIAGGDNLAIIFNYLVGKEVQGVALTDYMVAGIMGNMKEESGFEPMRLQGVFDRTVPAEEVYPTSPSSNPTVSRTGWGLVQWTPYTKIINPLTDEGKNPNDIYNQLDFLLAQLNGETASPESAAGRDLVATTNVAEATVSFETKYERHAGPPQPDRIVSAEEILSSPRSETPSGLQTVVALDPGHGGEVPRYIDEQTGLPDRETTNSPERENVLDVAQRVKADLEESGYRVLLLRESPDQSISKRERVNTAMAAGANIGISIHTTPGQINEVWPQFVGGFREKPDGTKVEFTDANIANLSAEYSQKIAEQRTASENHPVAVKNGFSASGRADIAPGNLTMIQLWAESVPWVYNEIEQNGSGNSITEQRIAEYAAGIANGVKQAIGPNEGSSQSSEGLPSCEGGSVNTGGLVGTITSYVWPDYRRAGSDGALDKKPEYDAAVDAAQQDGRYVGGIRYPGIDCGGFVTTVMYDSGFDTTYNHNATGGFTGIQLAWVRENWQSLGEVSDTSELQPGDVAFHVTSSGSNDGHTFMWVGEIEGYEYPVASSSLDQRAPMSGAENPLSTSGQKVEWYRKR